MAGEASDTARRIVSLREDHSRLIAENFGRVAGNGLKVLKRLYSRPIITVNNVIEITGVRFPAASQLMQKFVENGILFESTGQARNRRFGYDRYISLFRD